MKRLIIPLAIILALIIVGLGAFSWWNENLTAPSVNDKEIRFVIPKGRSATQIGEKLADEGLVKNPLAFKIYVQVTGKAKKVQAGEYTLSPNFSLIEVVDKLTSGPEELWVTVPEGLRREEIVDRFIEGLDVNLSQAAVFRQEFLEESEGFEGFLFPDTYLFPNDAQASMVVSKLRQTFEEKTEPLRDDIARSGYSQNQLVTLASIIERETKTEEERPIVAGILLKRLESGVPLQVDASVQYAVASDRCSVDSVQCDWWPVILRSDLEISSQYNSYKFNGFPPAPIANPGLTSLSAAVNPQGSEYWYYIHDPEGNIHYAGTLSEHNQNVRRYLGK